MIGKVCPVCGTFTLTIEDIEALRNAPGHKDPAGEPGIKAEDGLSLHEIRVDAVRSFAKWLIARPGNSIYCGDLPDLVLEYIERGVN